MKTLLLCHQSGDLYGSDRLFLTLVKILSENYKIVIVLDREGLLVRKLRRYSTLIIIHNLGSMGRKKSAFSTVLQMTSALLFLNKLVNKYKPNLILINTIIIPIPALVAKFRRIPAVWFIHEHPPSRIERFIFRYIVKSLSKRIVVPTNLISQWVSDTSYVIPFVEYIRYRKPRQKNNACKESVIKVACIGALHPKKGQKYFIQIAEELLKTKKKFKFYIIGGKIIGYEKYSEEILMELKARRLYSEFSILKFKENILDFMNEMDIVVVPSLYDEPFSLIIQEAMKVGKIIVATERGGSSVIINDGENGLLIPYNNAISSAKKIYKTISNRKIRNNMEKTAKRSYTLLFNYGRFKNEINNLIDEVSE